MSLQFEHSADGAIQFRQTRAKSQKERKREARLAREYPPGYVMSEASRKALATRALNEDRGGRKLYKLPLHPGAYPADLLRKSYSTPNGARIYTHPIGPRRKKQPISIETGAFWMLDSHKVRSIDPSSVAAVQLPAGMRASPLIFAKAVCAGCPSINPALVASGQSKMVAVVLIRHICFYAMNKGPLRISANQIGRRFHMDHSSVLYGVKRIQRLMREGFLPDFLPILFPPNKENADA